MSDIVRELRAIARMTEKEFVEGDVPLVRLAVAREKASEARFRHPPGSSRARVTTLNARWKTACEAYERRRADLLAIHDAVRAVPRLVKPR